MELRLLSILALSIILCGALGLRFVEECEGDPIATEAMKMQCYHSAAVTQAYLGSAANARNVCEQLWNRFGGSGDPNSDFVKRAEITYQACYYDVARITRDPSTCAYIQRKISNVDVQLFGDRVTRETCQDEVGRLANIAPERYYETNPNNICAIVFVLPLFILGTIKYSASGIRHN